MQIPIPSRRLTFGLMAFAASGLLASGLALGEFLRLTPCYLCNFQRFLYIVIALLSAFACVTNRWPRFWGLSTGLSALWGIATAAEQSWMQYAPDQVTECGLSDPTLVETIVKLAIHEMARDVHGHRILHRERLDLHWPDTSQLVSFLLPGPGRNRRLASFSPTIAPA